MKKLLHWLHNVGINLDRTVASAAGAPPDETISSEIGRHAVTNPVAKVADQVLDATLPGGKHGRHCEDAAAWADAAERGEREFY